MYFIAELGELFVSMYAEFISYAVPEGKRGAKKSRVIAAVAAYTMVAITVGLFAATAVLFGLEKKDAALITLYASLALAAIQVFGVVFFAAKRK
ncbi:MAG: hypothetical protein IJU94_02225 [Clostridia bacterium]|nr:hypothetical protein [Clostridia bacterium]